VLLDYMNFFGGGYEADLRRALDRRSRELDLNLLLIFGRALAEPRQGSAAHNAIFDLLDKSAVDGLIVASSLLSGHCGPEGVAEFLQHRYRGMPLVSLGIAIPAVPSILVDNRSGMHSVIEHLIQEHGCRRIAFVAGTSRNPEAEHRFAVYRELLERHGLPYDPALVEAGNFVKRSAFGAVEAILARTAAPDAVVAANDIMALGAIDALRRHGFRVPRQVAVTGFDDLSLAPLANPPLTTVSQPFEPMANLAVELILDQIAGRRVPEVTHLSTALTVRQSCGCEVRLSHKREPARVRPAGKASEELSSRRTAIASAVAAFLNNERDDGTASAELLLEALASQLRGDPEAFLRAIERLLERCGDDNDGYRGVQNAVTCLRGELRESETPELAELWYDALSLVALANTTAQVQHRLAVDESYLRLLSASEAFSVAFDSASLESMLTRGLPAAGVRTALIARCPDGALSQLELLVCLHDGVSVEITRERQPATRLLTPGAYLPDRRGSFLVFPLTFEAQKLGLVIFEYQQGVSGQQVLRDQISAALKSIELHEAVVQKTTLHERSLQERLATSKRMQSLSVLAGGVAHDLNNALGPLVGLPDIILRELSANAALADSASQVSADLESIKAAALRAAQTIKDLLTLGRQGHADKEALHLNQIISNCLKDDVLRLLSQVNPQVAVRLELCSTPVVVRASEAHLARAVTNLVHNALEAITGEGSVTVTTSFTRVTEVLSGYEQIEPGEYAVVTVADDGGGISQAELGRIFEPFFSLKRAGDRSGTGLGLAIVHAVVKEHDGFVDVASTPGVGTSFSLYLPRVRERPRVAERPEAPLGGRARVLIVDDDPVQLRTCRRILNHMGYEVETRNRGSSAYQLFADAGGAGQSPFDLVILDMSLNEERDGLEIFEQIQELYPEQRAIVASGHALNERVERAMSRGLAWLAKPYAADDLGRAVAAALRERARASGF
jgi:DNA-binding LacI/PurR family transcriptional regulator/signal transduction histidine kinase/ActR/RegA family two-component response regulator